MYPDTKCLACCTLGQIRFYTSIIVSAEHQACPLSEHRSGFYAESATPTDCPACAFGTSEGAEASDLLTSGISALSGVLLSGLLSLAVDEDSSVTWMPLGKPAIGSEVGEGIEALFKAPLMGDSTVPGVDSIVGL